MNENIVKDKIKFAKKCRQDEVVFLDTIIAATPTAKVVIATDMYTKKRSLASISAEIHTILKIKLKIKPKIYPLIWLTE